MCFTIFLNSKWLLQPVQFVGTKSWWELSHLMEPWWHSDPSLPVGLHLLSHSFFRELIVVSCTLMFVWDRRRPSFSFRAGNFMTVLFILSTLCKIWLMLHVKSCGTRKLQPCTWGGLVWPHSLSRCRPEVLSIESEASYGLEHLKISHHLSATIRIHRNGSTK